MFLCSFLVAADIAETLSKDMQKESLCGRTLTLKLKTATFEVLLLFHVPFSFPFSYILLDMDSYC